MRAGLAGLEALEADWTALYGSTVNQAFYNDWRWHAAIARHLITTDLYYLQISDQGKTVAVLPLQRQHPRRSRPFVTLPRHAHIVLGDVLVHRDYLAAPVLETAVHCLRSSTAFGSARFVLSKYSERSNLAALCRHAGIPERISGASFVARFGGDAAPTSPSDRQLRNVRRHEKKARSLHGSVAAEFVTDPGRLPEAFEQFMRIEASGWKGMQGTESAIRLHPPLVDFYRDLLSGFGRTNQACVSLLRFGPDYVAAKLSLRSGGTDYSLKVGYDEAHASLGPGSILLAEQLEQLRQSGTNYNMTTAPQWAEQWHFDREYTHEATLYRWRGATVAAHQARRLARGVKAGLRRFKAQARG